MRAEVLKEVAERVPKASLVKEQVKMIVRCVQTIGFNHRILNLVSNANSARRDGTKKKQVPPRASRSKGHKPWKIAIRFNI